MAKNTNKTQKCSGGGTTAGRAASQSRVPAGTYEILPEIDDTEHGNRNTLLLMACTQGRLGSVGAAGGLANNKGRYVMLTTQEIYLIMDFRKLTDLLKQAIIDFAVYEVQKNRQKKKPFDAANIKRQALKILSTTERKSL